jgi:hypothetical protein
MPPVKEGKRPISRRRAFLTMGRDSRGVRLAAVSVRFYALLEFLRMDQRVHKIHEKENG